GRAIAIVDAAGLGKQERAEIERAITDILGQRDEISDVRVVVTAERAQRRLIAIGSGKGGVGKSTLTANLAIALQKAGRKVGLVDADIYGPSQPVILGNQGKKPVARDEKLVPVESVFGIPVLSMGHLVEPGRALAWRGPMAGNALAQLVDAHWDDVDTLLVDLPPGTGDVQLTMLQRFKPVGAVLVSTPQDLALIDAARAGQLFDQAGVPVIGLVENMAGYACPHCGEVSDPFGKGGVETAAERLELPFLGRIPLDLAIREGSDRGKPPASGDDALANPFHEIAARVDAWIGAQS
ncbi:MAG: Mrp/NBP35 family ATP-binding protein, partial [Erythrobacter sp.]